MKVNLLFFLLVCLFGCSSTPTHVGPPAETSEGHEYSVADTQNGFIVAGHYSEYQFVRNSRKGFTGCATVINDAASDYAASKDKDVALPEWDEIEIIDHGRDLITAIMNVNCQYAYEFREPESDAVSGLERLKALLDTGSITQHEYDVLKRDVLIQPK